MIGPASPKRGRDPPVAPQRLRMMRSSSIGFGSRRPEIETDVNLRREQTGENPADRAGHVLVDAQDVMAAECANAYQSDAGPATAYDQTRSK